MLVTHQFSHVIIEGNCQLVFTTVNSSSMDLSEAGTIFADG